MTSPIKSIIFDFGGVLLEWNPHNLYRRYFPGQPEATDRFLTEINFLEWNAQQDKGRPFAEAVEILLAEFPQHAHLINAYYESWEETIDGPIEGTVEIMKQLKQAGYPLYGLSNWSAETFPYTRAKYKFFDLFDDMVISGAVGYVKPEPEIFHFMLEKIRRPANECLFIDDALTNIQQARKMGFQTIHFESPEQLKSELYRLGLL